jgi:hypothetical protein
MGQGADEALRQLYIPQRRVGEYLAARPLCHCSDTRSRHGDSTGLRWGSKVMPKDSATGQIGAQGPRGATEDSLAIPPSVVPTKEIDEKGDQETGRKDDDARCLRVAPLKDSIVAVFHQYCHAERSAL